MLKNDYLVAKIGVDTAENEPRKERCVVAMRSLLVRSEVVGARRADEAGEAALDTTIAAHEKALLADVARRMRD